MTIRITGSVLVALCACLLAAQVLIRPAIGQSNNGDFPKMAGPFGLGPENGSWQSHKQYGEFVYKYLRADRYLYNTKFRDSGYVSSEYFFVKLARGIQRIVRPGPEFDIRWLGAVHLLFLLIGVTLWIQLPPPAWKIPAGLLAVFIWTDAAYVQYMNTFYMDAAAIIFLVMCAAAAVRAAQEPDSRMAPVVAVSAGILFAASKTQHAIPALLFVPLFLALAFRSHRNLTRAVWIAGAVLLPPASYPVLSRATPVRIVPLFDIIFTRLAPESSDPLRTLQELGLGKDDLPYLRKNAYFPDVPTSDPVWLRQFVARCSYGLLARYYLHHPGVPLRILWSGLSHESSNLRPIANLSPKDGFQPYMSTKHFVWWSDFRGFLLKRAPWHMILLALFVFISAGRLLRPPGKRALGLVALAIQLVALAEYSESMLTETVDTTRHLILFHAATDISILLLPLLILESRYRKKDHSSLDSRPVEVPAVTFQP